MDAKSHASPCGNLVARPQSPAELRFCLRAADGGGAVPDGGRFLPAAKKNLAGCVAQRRELLAADLRLESPSSIRERYFTEAFTPWASARPTPVFSDRQIHGTLEAAAARNALTARLSAARHVRSANAPFGVARPTASCRPRRVVDRRAHHRPLKIELGSSLRSGAASCLVSEVLDLPARIRAPVSSISHPPAAAQL